MRIQVISIKDLSSEELNCKGGTLEETLRTSELNYDLSQLAVNENNFRVGQEYVGMITYRGKTAGEYLGRGRTSKDWTEIMKTFNLHHSPNKTAKQIAVISGLKLEHVYYMAKKLNVTLVKGKRGRRQ